MHAELERMVGAFEQGKLTRRQLISRLGALVAAMAGSTRLEAAVAARNDPGTFIVARTSALTYFPLDEALDRISAYSQTGVEAVRLTGLKTREQLEAIHQATPLPLTVLSPPDDMRNDRAFMAANGVSIVMAGNPAFGIAVKAVYDCFKHLKDGGDVTERRLRVSGFDGQDRQGQEQRPWDPRPCDPILHERPSC